MDIVYVIDTSNSISNKQFQKLRESLADLNDKFNIGPGPFQTRVAAVGFGKTAERFFDFDEHMDIGSLRQAFLNMQRVEDYRGTYTDLGIDLMMKTFAGSFGNRAAARDISIVLTDGRSSKPGKLYKKLEELKTKDITQFAIGIGKYIDEEELVQIAKDDSNHVFTVSSFDEIYKIAQDLSNVGCSELLCTVITLILPCQYCTMSTILLLSSETLYETIIYYMCTWTNI